MEFYNSILKQATKETNGIVYLVNSFEEHKYMDFNGLIATTPQNAADLLMCMMVDGETNYTDYDYTKVVEDFFGDPEQYKKEIIHCLLTHFTYENHHYFIKAIPNISTEEVNNCKINLKNGYSMYDALI